MFFPGDTDIFCERASSVDNLEPWKPRPLTHDEWASRDYRAVYAWRLRTLAMLRADADMLVEAWAYYSTRPGEWIMHWCDTYDPRKSPNADKPELRGPKWMPMIFFAKQAEIVEWLHELCNSGESGLCEKARDMGVTWIACQYSVWSWIFNEGDTIGWGSRKQELVDRIGDASSIFEKLRLLIRRLPDIWTPKGLRARDHLKSMNITNPANGSSIIGEIGKNIGRGGRTSKYFKDESAHYENPEDVQAALDDNTHVQIDISSVNGFNLFHRKREAGEIWQPGVRLDPGVTRVLVVDWRDHPEKTQAWYDQRAARAEREGMQHILAQEVDRNYAAAVQNTIIDMEWINAAVDAHLKIPYLRVPPPNVWSAGLDVADGGNDTNALALRQWIILRSCEQWAVRDPGVTMRRTIAALRGKPKGIKIQADLIGVGSGVKTEYNRLIDDKVITKQDFELVFWNAGGAVVNKLARIIPGDLDSPTNGDFFANFKAQAWWSLRTRFYKTWRAVMSLASGQTLEIYNPEELISLDSAIPLLNDVKKQLAQPTKTESTGLRTLVDKTPNGQRSPNLGDAICQTYFPVPDNGNYTLIGGMAG